MSSEEEETYNDNGEEQTIGSSSSEREAMGTSHQNEDVPEGGAPLGGPEQPAPNTSAMYGLGSNVAGQQLPQSSVVGGPADATGFLQQLLAAQQNVLNATPPPPPPPPSLPPQQQPSTLPAAFNPSSTSMPGFLPPAAPQQQSTAEQSTSGDLSNLSTAAFQAALPVINIFLQHLGSNASEPAAPPQHANLPVLAPQNPALPAAAAAGAPPLAPVFNPASNMWLMLPVAGQSTPPNPSTAVFNAQVGQLLAAQAGIVANNAPLQGLSNPSPLPLPILQQQLPPPVQNQPFLELLSQASGSGRTSAVPSEAAARSNAAGESGAAGSAPAAAAAGPPEEEDPGPLPPSAIPVGDASAMTNRPALSLHTSFDSQILNPYQCLLRQQIELFETGSTGVEGRSQGRNTPIKYGQLGIRCIYCARLPNKVRPKVSEFRLLTGMRGSSCLLRLMPAMLTMSPFRLIWCCFLLLLMSYNS